MQKQLRNVILVLFFFSSTTLFSAVTYENSSTSGCLMADSLELVTFYSALDGGPNWVTDWDLNMPVSTWHGVTLSMDGCSVEKIILPNSGLNGDFTNLNLNLPKLEILFLSNNNISGKLPVFFNLVSLKELYLDNNSITGMVPRYEFSPTQSFLPNLEILHLQYNNLTGVDDNIKLPALKELYLHYNQLIGDLSFLNNPGFSKLEHLKLNNNQLSGEIVISSLTIDSLIFLNLSNNNLSFTSLIFLHAPRLKEIIISDNIIEKFTHLSLPNTVEKLILDNNQTTGTIPNINAPNLKHLSLANNSFSGLIPSFSNIQTAQYINLSNNQLAGEIPDFSSLNNLQFLSIAFNHFDFGDLETNYTPNKLNIPSFIYNPQAIIPITVLNGQLVVNPGGTGNHYTWYHDGIAVQSGNSNAYTPTMAGDYYCHITNFIMTNSSFNGQNLTLLGKINQTGNFAYDDNGSPYEPKQIIVQLVDLTTQEKDSLRVVYSSILVDSCLSGELELWKMPDVMVVSGDNNVYIDIEERIGKVRRDTDIEEGEKNYILSLAGSKIKRNSTKKITEERIRQYQKILQQKKNTDSSTNKVKVAILDSGIDPIFANYSSQNDINLIDKTPFPIDDIGHGTAVAGRIINAYQDNFSSIKIPVDTLNRALENSLELISVKVVNDSTKQLWHLLCGAWYARNLDVDIVNISVGYHGTKSRLLAASIRALRDTCVLVVTSAGNEGINTDLDNNDLQEISHYPSALSEINNAADPCDNVISVGGTEFFDSNEGRMSESNYGLETVDIGYPGDIYPSIPSHSNTPKGGTSFSAAGITGLAAKLKIDNPGISYLDIKNSILHSTSPLLQSNSPFEGGITFAKIQTVLDTVTRQDCICKPVLHCVKLDMDLDPLTGLVEVAASDFDAGSYFNCLPPDVNNPLVFQFEDGDFTKTFSCTDVGVGYEFNLFVQDPLNLIAEDYCTDSLFINNPDMIACDCPSTNNVMVTNIDSDYYAANSLTSDGVVTIGNTATFTAGNSIHLLPGFTVEAGANFTASIGDCPNTLFVPDDFPTTPETHIKPINNTISIAPNPFSASTKINYQLEETANVEIYLSNIQGRMIKQIQEATTQAAGTHELRLENSNFNPGMYFLLFRAGNDFQAHKLIVVNNN